MECRPEKVSNAVLDENVDICLVRKYFSQEAWMLVEEVLREDPIWICSICQDDLHCEPCMICESCLERYHFRCVEELVLPLLSLIMTQLVTVAVTPSYFCCIVQTFHYTYQPWPDGSNRAYLLQFGCRFTRTPCSVDSVRVLHGSIQIVCQWKVAMSVRTTLDDPFIRRAIILYMACAFVSTRRVY